MTGFTRILVLDFDGTVCLGDGPVFSYARLLDAALGATASGDEQGGSQHPSVLSAVEEYLSTSGTTAVATSRAITPPRPPADTAPPSPDGYAAAERFARSRGVGAAALSAAYEGSRAELAQGLIETHAPAGLAEVLADLPETVQTILVTNAPLNGVEQQLDHLGLAAFFDRVVASAGKPTGMQPILRGLLADQRLSPSPTTLLSVGDIWQNDLEPAAAIGCSTALIERFSSPTATPTYRAPLIEELYPAINAWAMAPVS